VTTAGALLEHLLTAPVEAAPCEDVARWWTRHRALAQTWSDPVALAIAGGYAADRIGWAFASGYQAALRALLSDLPPDTIAAFCVTEADGNRPKDIRTTLERGGDAGWRLSGSKRWTTLGPDGGIFIVAARDARVSGERPAIRMVRVPSASPGVTIEPMPPTRFVPEVPHAQLRFDGVALAAGALLPGDGYDDYVKPFRCIEDVYVSAATLAYTLREARRFGWPQDWLQRALAVLEALRGLAGEDPTAAATHLALAGALAAHAQLLEEADAHWARAEHAPDAAARGRWLRDRELGSVAGKARALRTERAWQRRGAPGRSGG
jgi:alkylation response protein AidB-like acyl-CoA dehydrogenase